MVKKRTYIAGFLAILIAATGVYITLPGQVKIGVEKDYTQLFVWKDGDFRLAGTESGYLYHGAELILPSDISVTSSYDKKTLITTVIRTSQFPFNISIRDIYVFNGNIKDITQIPVSHTVTIKNAKDYTYLYQVKDLPRHVNGDVKSPFAAGNVQVQWQNGSSSANYMNGVLKINFPIKQNFQTFSVRLLDPPVTEYSCDFSVDSCGFTGGTVNTAQKLYNATAASSTFYAPWSRSCTDCNISFMVNIGSLTGDNAKAYYATGNGTKVNERYLIEAYNTSHLRVKPEPGYNFEIGNIPNSSWFKIVIQINDTSGNSTIFIYNETGSLYATVSGSKVQKSFTVGSKFFAFYTGTYIDHVYFTNYSVVDLTGSGATLQPPFRVDLTGPINFTLNNPLNVSNFTASSVTLNVTVYNLNVSAGGGAGTLPQTLLNDSFTSTPFASWTQGSWGWSSAGGGVINNTADSGSSAYTPNLGLSAYTNGYNITLNMSMTNFTNAKIYFGTNSGSLDGDRILLERTGNGGTQVNIKHDGTPFGSITVNANQYLVVTINVNLTKGNLTVCSGGSCWNNAFANSHLTVNGSYIAFVPGNNMSLNAALDQFGWNISDILVQNVGTAYVIGAGNSTLNVSFYNSSNTLLQFSPGVANGSTVTFPYTVAAGRHVWYATVRTENNVLNVSNLEFNTSDPNPDILSSHMFANHTFEVTDNGWTGHDTQTLGYIHLSPSSPVRMYSPNLSLYSNTTRKNGYTVIFEWQSDNSSYTRFYPATNDLAELGPYYYLEYNTNTNLYSVKYFDGEAGYSDVLISGLTLNGIYKLNISMNLSAGTTAIKIYNSSGTIVTKGPFTFTPAIVAGADYVNIQKGTITTYDRLYSFEAWDGTWSPIPAGTLAVTYITPTTDSSFGQGQMTNFTVNITCISGESGATCGNVQAYLDPRIVNWWFNSSTTFVDVGGAGPRHDLNGATWDNVYNELMYNWINNPSGSLFQTFTDTTTGKPVVWVPWFTSSTSFGTYHSNQGGSVGSCGSASSTCNIEVSDEHSEWFIGIAHDGTEDVINKSINAIEACAVGVSNPPLTSWNCYRNGNTILKQDSNFATDADSRYVEGYWVCYAREDLSTALRNRCKANAQAAMYKLIEKGRKINACHDTPWGGAQQCAWWAAGGTMPGVFGQSSQQYMFIGYYETVLKSLIATRYYTGNTSLDTVIDQTASDFLYASGYTGTSGTAMTAGYYNFWWTCPAGTGVCTRGSFTAATDGFGGVDGARAWAMCENVDLADILYSGGSEPTSIDTYLRDFCNDWSSKYTANYNAPSFGGTILYSNGGVCVSLSTTGTCRDVDTSYKMGYGGPMIVYKHDTTQFNAFMTQALREYYSSTHSYNQQAYGIYDMARNIRTVRYATGRDLLLLNATPQPTGAPPADTTPPVITNVQSSIAGTSATITWSTDESSDSTAFYGTTNGGPYPNTASGNSITTSHFVTINGLSISTTYYYKIQSCDPSNNCANSSAGSFITTTPVKNAGDLVSTSVGALPFYTIDTQPHNASCLSSMQANSSCLVTWRINTTGSIGSVHTFYVIYSSEYNAVAQTTPLAITIATAADTTPPVISAVSTPTLACGVAGPVYTTNEGANTTITYWQTAIPGTTYTYYQNSYVSGVHGTLSLTNNISHQGVSYTFNILSCDVSGNCATFLGTQFTTLDCQKPSLVNYTNSTSSNSTAAIYWETDELANASIKYGTSTTSLTLLGSDATFKLNRTISLSSLLNGQQYFVNLTSCDSVGLCNTTGPFNFTTRDSIAPIISSISTTTTTSTTTISVTANENVNVSANYGTTFSLGLSQFNVSLGNPGQVRITGLTASTTYQVNVTSCDASGNCVINATNFSTATISVGYTFCPNIGKLDFAPDVRSFNFTTGFINQLLIPAFNQSPCLFNLTNSGAFPYNWTVVANTSSTGTQKIYCGTSLATKSLINTSAKVLNNSATGTISCWMDMINVSQANYKDFNITITEVPS